MTRVAVLGLVGILLGADLLASDLPLVTKVDSTVYWLPCVFRPTALRGEDNRTLALRAAWLIAPPIRYGPLQTAATTGESSNLPPPWSPTWQHPFGTDELGRDVAARLIHGTRVSISIAIIALVVALVLGLVAGGVAGVKGGWPDALISRLMEVVGTFPTLFFLLAWFAVLRQPSLISVGVVLGCTRWHEVARLVRAEAMTLLRRDSVRAARAMGASWGWVLRRHLVPQALGPLAVTAAGLVGSTLVLESGLAFLGLGVTAPTPSWGALLLEGQRHLSPQGAWWLVLFPGVALGGTVLLLHVVGNAARLKVDGEA
jgi:peptide/nickel transport system permease protein